MTKEEQKGGERWKEGITHEQPASGMPTPLTPPPQLPSPASLPALPAKNAPFPPPSLPGLSRDSLPRGTLLPLLVLRQEAVPLRAVPHHLVLILEPLLVMCRAGGCVPEGEQEREAEHLCRPPLLLLETRVPARAAPAAPPEGLGAPHVPPR